MKYFLTIFFAFLVVFYTTNIIAKEDKETVIISSPEIVYIKSFIGPRIKEYFLSLDPTKIKKVVLNSRGGKLYDAMAIAEIIYKHKIQTEVVRNGKCYSACVLVFQAGKTRTAYVPSRFMVHYAYITVENNKITDTPASWKYFLKLIEYGMLPELIEEIIVQNRRNGGDLDLNALDALKYNIVNHLIVD